MFKKIVKWFLLPILLLVGLGAAFIAHEWYSKPFFINNFFNRFALKIVLNSPETLTSLHFLEQFGINAHNGRLDDVSPEANDQLFDFIAQEAEVLKGYRDDSLSKEERLSKRIAEYLFDIALQLKPYRYHNYPVNQLFGVQNQFPTFMQAQHQINNEEDADYYLQRLEAIAVKFSQTIEGMRYRQQHGIVPPKFVIDRVDTEIEKFIETPIEDNILYTSFKAKLDKLNQLDGARKEELLQQARYLIDEKVYPAYQTLLVYMQGLADKADNRVGYWALPQGEQAYQVALRFFTTTDYKPDYIHEVGLQEVRRIQHEILQILEAEGYDIADGFSKAMESLASNDKFYYPDTAEGRQKILEDYQKILDEIDEGIGQAFNLRPQAKLRVERIPQFKEKTSPGAYYNAPALDGSRPGIFYANLYDIKATPKYSMRTLAYHEGIPGHHFQIAIAQELDELPFFRRMAPFTAYIEGWALYAERLAWELGFQQDPYDNIGRLQAELFRAVRLVVDTGIHAKRWTRQEAIDYMIENTGMAESDVIAEVERYIVMPGQACAYKVGMMKILELRTRAQKELGAQFNLAEFHDVILGNGAVPLEILEELVEEYIAGKR